MSNFWDERYGDKEYVYGTNPNHFLKVQLHKFPKGKILFPCDGEGRNSVYAAKIGWQTESFDQSIEGMKKAQLLAKQNNVDISYQVADALEIEFIPNTFDAVALLYTHFPTEIRSIIHKKIISWLKPGGVIILEAFNPLQLNNTSGGPKDINMLYSKEIILKDFNEFKNELLTEETIILDEGNYHQGKADVVRYVGIKIQ